jgi:dynein heavy chain
MASLGVFAGQEIERFNQLLGVMKRSLDQLDRAIAGTVVMSQELEAMASRFLDDRVPATWEAVGYPSLKPLGSWVADLIERVEFVARWLYGGDPASYWVPAFFFPQGFMTAALQGYARKTRTPIDALQFRAGVLTLFAEALEAGPADGVYIHGLYLQGAQWDLDKAALEDSEPRVPIVRFPVVWLEPVSVHEPPEQGCYACPFYKTSTRRGELSTTGHSTNFVGYLALPSQRPADYWVRRGVALLSMTDD